MNRIEVAVAIERALETNYVKIKRSFLKKQAKLQEVLEEFEPASGVPQHEGRESTDVTFKAFFVV